MTHPTPKQLITREYVAGHTNGGYPSTGSGSYPHPVGVKVFPHSADIARAKLEMLDEVEAIVAQHVIPGHAAGGAITGGIFAKLAALRAHLKGDPR